MKKLVKVISAMLMAALCLSTAGCAELGLNTEEEKECSLRYAVSVKEATAEEDGLKTLMCTKCGYTVTEIIPAGETEEEEKLYMHMITWKGSDGGNRTLRVNSIKSDPFTYNTTLNKPNVTIIGEYIGLMISGVGMCEVILYSKQDHYLLCADPEGNVRAESLLNVTDFTDKIIG